MRIRRKISLVMSIAIVVTISIFAIIVVNMEKKNVIKQQCDEQKVCINFYNMKIEEIIDDMRSPTYLNNRGSIEAYMTTKLKDNWLKSEMYKTLNGKNIQYAIYDEIGKRYWYNSSEYDVQPTLKAKKDVKQIILQDNRKHYLVTAMLDDVNGISLYTVADISDVYTYLNQIRFVIILTGFLLCVFTILLIQLLIGRMLSSLKLLEKYVKKVGSGQFAEKIELHSHDEMQEFADCFNDMTDKLGLAMKEKEQEIENREMLINALSHELKTPITSIKGCAQTLTLTKLSEDQQRELLVMMDKECSRLEKLSQKMMQLLIVKTMDQTSFVDCAVMSLLENVKKAITTVHEKKQLSIAISADCSTIYGDEELLYELIANLTDNAAKACKNNGHVTISIKENVLTIEDDGVGIKEENKDNIFLPFFMEDKSRSRKNNGVGLGLAICARIVELHGYEVKVDSMVGKGTKIAIYNLFTK